MSTATTERPKTVENIKVLQVGKYGVRVDEKLWFGVNEPLTPTHFQVGEGYKVSVTASKTGKKYINEIIGQEEKVPASSEAGVPVVSPKSQTSTKTPSDKPMTREDWDSKDRRISRQGLYQAALQSPAAVQWSTNVTEYLSVVRQLAEEGLKFVAE